jgi:hypothetical protein
MLQITQIIMVVALLVVVLPACIARSEASSEEADSDENTLLSLRAHVFPSKRIIRSSSTRFVHHERVLFIERVAASSS